jgi:DUF1009 family protein
MIAGTGELPELIVQQRHMEGRKLLTIALSAEVASRLAPYCPTLVQYGPGQLSKIIRTLKQHTVRQVVIIGKFPKHVLFGIPRVDLRALRLLSRAPNYQDVTLLHTLIAEFAREGIEVVEQTRLLSHLITPVGTLGARQPTKRQWSDIRFGFKQAKQLAGMDIGQTIVVRRQTVLAVEAVEGTDATIQRGGRLGGHGAVVIKVSRPCQDMRFDVPTVGPHTLQTVIDTGAVALAVEAGATLMIHRPQLVDTANKHRIALLGISGTALHATGAG